MQQKAGESPNKIRFRKAVQRRIVILRKQLILVAISHRPVYGRIIVVEFMKSAIKGDFVSKLIFGRNVNTRSKTSHIDAIDRTSVSPMTASVI